MPGTGDYRTIAVFNTPLGLQVELDESVLTSHAIKHGEAWANIEQARLVFEEPTAIYHTQHQHLAGVLLFYRPAEIVTPHVKLVYGAADFRYGSVGRAMSIHPKEGIPNTVTRLVYPVEDKEATDADE